FIIALYAGDVKWFHPLFLLKNRHTEKYAFWIKRTFCSLPAFFRRKRLFFAVKSDIIKVHSNFTEGENK
ncbi:MAG: hypothetical protein IJC82_04475, partial [Firmicutes bacterium]|nr:hypothetical protein [Bacillota bacterium]